MLNERPPFYQPNLSRGSGLRLLRAECPKRKLNPIVHLNYPSPPMSIPPLSPKTPLDHSASPSRQPPVAAAATADRANTTTTTTTTSTTLPMPTATATSVAYSPSNYASRAQDLFTHPYHPTTPNHPSRSFHTFSTRQPPPISGPSSTAVSESSSTIPGPSPKGGRKPKAHVASACINCKRAHLSCDINRPCARCVSSGKQVRGWQSIPNAMMPYLMQRDRIPASTFSTRNVDDRGFEKMVTLEGSAWSPSVHLLHLLHL